MPPATTLVPAAAAAGDGDPAAPAPAARPNPLAGLVRMFVMWYLARALFGGNSKPAAKLPREAQLWPALARGTPVDLAFFLTEGADPPADWDTVGGPVWAVERVPLGVERGERFALIEYTPSEVSVREGVELKGVRGERERALQGCGCRV